MPSLYTEIDINAPRSRVWQILIQKEKWKYWNTFLYDCNPHQTIAPGREISLSLLRVPGEEEIQFRPIVTLVQPEACLKWMSSIPGFRHEYIWQLQDLDRDHSQFIYQETFSGALSKFFVPFIRQDEQKGMRRMAWELKQYAEKL
ncbi:MAG: SRPBCC domain-containing protein [Myxacorys chilensis ATA2-1-KO14]|jgi:hypothetical protein|nr:SRPBCC domain-containing protein [Myxacorys chilensis ATA2-1-KO14]